MQPGLCTRHCHIKQTSFFLHILVQHRAAVRRDALIGIENLDNGTFQPLGTVQRRERDRVRLRPPLRRLPEQFRQAACAFLLIPCPYPTLAMKPLIFCAASFFMPALTWVDTSSENSAEA